MTVCINVSIHIKLLRLSVCVCLPDFSTCADRFPWNFSWFTGVIGRRERIKTSGKFRPLMCKNWENGAKWPISRKSPRVIRAGLHNGLQSEFACTPACWPKVRLRHRPIARWPGAWPVAFDRGPYQTLLCSWVQFSGLTSRPAFGRVNANNITSQYNNCSW